MPEKRQTICKVECQKICQKESQNHVNNVSIHARKFVRLKCHGGDHSKSFFTQVRVARSMSAVSGLLLLLLLVLRAVPQLRGSHGSVLRRTSTARAVWQCSPPDLNCEGPVAVFSAGAGPQLRGPCGSVPCRTSTVRAVWQFSPPDLTWQCFAPDLNREGRVAVSPAGPQLRGSRGSVPRGTSRSRGSVLRRTLTASQKKC